jgi:N-acetylmuramic acid 6-phosphate etherase
MFNGQQRTMTLPPTEQRNPASMELDRLSSLALVTLMNQEDGQVIHAVHAALPQIARAVDQIVAALAAGGRWFVMGAGTSGRLALLDAVELLPTFGLPPDLVIPLLAGGEGAFIRSVENAEDRPELGAADLESHGLTARDIVLGVAASGRTPYVLGGLAHARRRDAGTGLQPRLAHRRRSRAGHRGGDRTGSADRQHTPQGGHRTEVGTQHAQHGHDGRPRQDL